MTPFHDFISANTNRSMLRHEVDTLGFPLSYHPLERYRSILKNLDYVRACDLHAHVGERVRAIGWPVTSKTILTKEGNPMKFISFEDTTGSAIW